MADDELIHLMGSGDEQAFLRLYRQHQPAIYKFAYHMTGSPAVAEDVTQEVFLTLIEHPKKYNPERAPLSAYLYGIARNRVLRWSKKNRAYTTLPNDFNLTEKAASSPLKDLTREQTIEMLRGAILTLPVSYREVVIFCDLQELSYSDAAQILDCPVGTVRSRLFRARALLLAKLRPNRAEQENAGGGNSYELSAI